jgi:serpin B
MKMSRVLAALAIAAAALASAAPAAGARRTEAGRRSEATAAVTPAALTEGNRRFALDLYREIRAEHHGNLFFSPMSVALAVAPLTAGAAGETRAQIARTLAFPTASDGFHPAMAALQRGLEREGENATFSIANAFWLSRSFMPLPAFLDNARAHYDMQVERLDFGGDADGAAARINAWASEATHGRIPHVVDPPMFSDRTRLVVTNAVYFLADWARPFPAGSEPAPFTLAGGRRIDVPMMKRLGHYRHHDGGDFAGLDIPYRDERLVMTILLPDSAEGLAALERRLTPALLDRTLRALDGATESPVDLTMPRLNLTADYALTEPLKRLGMRLAFGNADFSGLSTAPLAIDGFSQYTFLRVDEQGTEAAAVTVGGIIITGSRRGPRVIDFHADRPFLFMLRDRESGAILFLGRILRPQ